MHKDPARGRTLRVTRFKAALTCAASRTFYREYTRPRTGGLMRRLAPNLPARHIARELLFELFLDSIFSTKCSARLLDLSLGLAIKKRGRLFFGKGTAAKSHERGLPSVRHRHGGLSRSPRAPPVKTITSPRFTRLLPRDSDKGTSTSSRILRAAPEIPISTGPSRKISSTNGMGESTTSGLAAAFYRFQEARALTGRGLARAGQASLYRVLSDDRSRNSRQA